MSGLERVFLVVLLIWNMVTFLIMKLDKHKAIKGKRRISEKTLFIFAFIMGGLGIYAGMYSFRHKTKHWSFKILIPLAIILNFYLVYLVHSL